MFFSVITKNLSWEILTKDFLYYEGSLKNPSFRGRVTKNQYKGGHCLKKGGGTWTVGGLIPQCIPWGAEGDFEAELRVLLSAKKKFKKDASSVPVKLELCSRLQVKCVKYCASNDPVSLSIVPSF